MSECVCFSIEFSDFFFTFFNRLRLSDFKIWKRKRFLSEKLKISDVFIKVQYNNKLHILYYGRIVVIL